MMQKGTVSQKPEYVTFKSFTPNKKKDTVPIKPVRDIKEKQIECLKWDGFDASKLLFTNLPQMKFEGCYPFKACYPLYRFSEKLTKGLYIKTPFFKVETPLFKNFTHDSSRPSINIDTTSLGASMMIDCLIAYDNTFKQSIMGNNIISASNGNEKNMTPIVTNKNDFGRNITSCHPDDMVNKNKGISSIKLMLPYNSSTGIVNIELITYIAKRYAANEMNENITLDQLKKLIDRKKEIRCIVKPFSWVHPATGRFGSKLVIIKMEVKYEGASIKSLIDQKGEEILDTITEISI